MTKKEIAANINTFTRQQIVEMIDEIEAKTEYWKRCKDGSYEMAFSEAGGYVLCNRLQELNKQM